MIGTYNKEPWPYKVPFPKDFIIPDADPPATPNNCAAILLPDGESILQTWPLCRNVSGGPIFGHLSFGENITTQNTSTFTSIYSDGIYGGHGGSGLSSIGGTVRKGELLPNSTGIKHVLKWEFNSMQYYYNPHNTTNNSDHSICKRWPAVTCDIKWTTEYNGTVPATKIGSLLAIPPSMKSEIEAKLESIPGKMILNAMVDYGAYIVDSVGWNENQFCVELGVQQEFNASWGYDMIHSVFSKDIMYMTQFFHVVDNNGPNNIGGGGTPRQPKPPPIGN